MAVITRMSDACKARDITEMMGCFALEENVVLIGTAADEQRIGPE